MVWAIALLPLLTWGLPTNSHDATLFGGAPPWPGERYGGTAALAVLRASAAGADVDLTPLDKHGHLVDLVPDEASRAGILLGYRLYSRQPDELIILRALARMNPRQLDFDPQLYQYGGGYLYLVGAVIGAAGAAGCFPLSRDLGVYLENPAAIGGFYVAARFVSLAFGAATLIAIARLARATAGRRAAWLALLAGACSPVLLSAVCEAKPHLPSACLLLWAGLSALEFLRTPSRAAAVRLGLQSGYAFALTLTGLAGALFVPALYLALPTAQRTRLTLRRLALAAGLFAAVYVVLNPYLFYNAIFEQQKMVSNLSNSTAMYEGQAQQFQAGLERVVTLVPLGIGVGTSVLGLVGFALLLCRRTRATLVSITAGAAILTLGVLIGAQKPAEFARFLILPLLLLAVAAGIVVAWGWRRHVVWGVLGLLLLSANDWPLYLHAFWRDAGVQNESRTRIATRFTPLVPDEPIGLLQEPAPYSVPPFDFAHGRFVLLPENEPTDLDPADLPRWLIFTADHVNVHRSAWWQRFGYVLIAVEPPDWRGATQLTWANKRVFVYERAP